VDCVRYKEDFVIWRFVISRFYNTSLYFIVTLVGLRSIVCDKSDCHPVIHHVVLIVKTISF